MSYLNINNSAALRTLRVWDWSEFMWQNVQLLLADLIIHLMMLTYVSL